MARFRVATPPRSARPSEWTAYMAQGRVSSALLLFGVLLFIVWLKRGQVMPDRRTAAGLLVSAFIVAASASVAPDFVTMLMLATLVVVALDSQDVIINALQRLQSTLGAGPTGTPGAAGVRPI